MKASRLNSSNNALLDDLMIEIPAGTIEMRDDRINRRWTVELNPFYLSKYPVTQNLYYHVTGENPSTFKGDQRPVETISWEGAVRFCNKLSEIFGLNSCYTLDSQSREVTYLENKNGFRLPAEAEWQYACQAGSGKIRYGTLEDIAWYKENSDGKTHDVGLKTPNKWGLYDMLGNVWEWCSDIYDESVYGSYRIFRGGGWCDQERAVMSTTRRRSHPHAFSIDDLGFRIARNGS